MKRFSVFLLAAAASISLSFEAQAQRERVWRCGNEYSNNPALAQQPGCNVVEGGSLTIIQSRRPTASAPVARGARAAAAGVRVAALNPAATAQAPAGSPRVNAAEQRARDSDARAVLEAELRKTKERQTQLLRDFNNGEPDKMGGESKNYQKYLDRVADMKVEMARNEADIAGLQREIGRLPALNR